MSDGDRALEERLRRTFTAIADTTTIGPRSVDELTAPLEPHHRRRGWRTWTATVAVAAAFVAGALIVVHHGHATPTRVDVDRPASSVTSVASFPFVPPSRPGLTAVADENGDFVGYVRTKFLDMPSDEYEQTVNARTMWPVVDAHDTVVGYIAPDVPFIPIAVTEQPGFDIEKVRAAREGDCEDQIGDPNFTQEFPRCETG